MSNDPVVSPTRVLADLPWHSQRSLAGIIRLTADSLLLEPRAGQGKPVAIPLEAIEQANVETTFGVLPVLEVRHRLEGREVGSRFEFGHEEDDQPEHEEPGLAGRFSPGLAQEAAGRLEGGLRALAGGINRGMRTARQAVDGLARVDEYRAWPAAIAQAQTARRARRPATAEKEPVTATPRPLVPTGVAVPSDDSDLARWFNQEVLGWVRACGDRARELAVRGAPIIQADYPLDSPVCRIVVAGEFSRGKSTVINALFGIHGEIALPTGMTPTTPLACAIRVPRVGESDGATITYRTARPARELSLEEFRAGVRLAEEGQEAADGVPDLHLREARRVEVRITGAYLPAGVEIEDTPGLNEQAGRSAGALAALGRADLILFVLAADQLLGDLEREVIQQTLAAGHHRNVLFLINFWDTIESEEQRAVLLQRARTVLASFPTPFTDLANPEGLPHVFTISALMAVRAQRQHRPAPDASGIPALRARLRRLLGPESMTLLPRARVGRALRYCALLRLAVSRAGAARAAEGRGGEGARRDEAMAAALRVVEGLPGAVEGATARPLARLRAGETAELRALPPRGQERARAAALRVALGEVGQAARQAADLVLAQTRAAYLSRGLPAPAALVVALDAPLPLPSPAEPEVDLAVQCERAAARAHAELEARARAAQEDLTTAIRAAHPAVKPAPEAGERAVALRLLEEDLLRLENILARCRLV